jgi:putative SOS response-associated peptidase YedK
MCGRTTLTVTPEDFQRAFGFAPPPGYRPRYNIAPSQEVLALAEGAGGPELRRFRWGLVPFWAKDPTIGNRLINARAETVTTKPAFRAAYARRRCLVLADGYYEWMAAPGGKRPHRICLRGGQPFTLAALWERWDRGPDPLETCTLLTTVASPALSRIHDRMPVVIAAAARERWLSSGVADPDLPALLNSACEEEWLAYEVSTRVNRPTQDVPECIEPLSAAASERAQQVALRVL